MVVLVVVRREIVAGLLQYRHIKTLNLKKGHRIGVKVWNTQGKILRQD